MHRVHYDDTKTHEEETLRTEGDIYRTVKKMIGVTCADKHVRRVSSCKLSQSFQENPVDRQWIVCCQCHCERSKISRNEEK